MNCPARLLAGSAIALSALALGPATSPAQLPPPEMQLSLAPMLEELIRAVVSVRVTGERYRPIEFKPVSDEKRGLAEPPEVPKEPFKAGGSGVIVDPGRGLIVTNNHVIADATTIMVALADGRVFDARLMGR